MQDELRMVVKGWISRFLVLFPDYGRTDEPVLRAIIAEFTAAFSDVSATPDEASEAMVRWRNTGKRFPVPADIIDLVIQKRPSPVAEVRDSYAFLPLYRAETTDATRGAPMTEEQWAELRKLYPKPAKAKHKPFTPLNSWRLSLAQVLAEEAEPCARKR